MWQYCNVFGTVLQVLQSDGGNYSVCVNAATLALIDAGIALRDVVCACTAAVLGTDSMATVVDVNNVEESTSRGAVMTVAVLPKSGQIVHVEMTGRLHEEGLPVLLDSATTACHDVLSILDDVIRDHVTALASTIVSSS